MWGAGREIVTDTKHRKVAHSGGTALTSQERYTQKSDVIGVDVR